MKHLIAVLVVMLPVSSALAGYPGTVLFSDSYDRPNNTDIDASSVGMSGTLSPMTYVESFEGSGVNTSIQIASNQLNVAFGPAMSNLYLKSPIYRCRNTRSGGFSIH
jgi:hypothetical protein